MISAFNNFERENKLDNVNAMRYLKLKGSSKDEEK
ncbi:hypothetical protein ACNA6I_17505 [Rossellomorea sp. FS2]